MLFSQKQSHLDYEVILHVERPEPLKRVPNRKFFIPRDVIRGRVDVAVFKEIAVKDIQVKVQGLAATDITMKRRTANGKNRIQSESMQHEVFYDVVTVFPPSNVREVSSNKKFTLTKGHYSYDFEIQLPLNSHCGDQQSKHSANLHTSKLESGRRKDRDTDNMAHCTSLLPPSFWTVFGTNKATVQYSIKLSVHRAEFFSKSSRLRRPLTIGSVGQLLSQIEASPILYMDSTTRTLAVSIDDGPKDLSSSSKGWASSFFQSSSRKERKMDIKVKLQVIYREILCRGVRLLLYTSWEPAEKQRQPPPEIFLRGLEMTITQNSSLKTHNLFSEHQSELGYCKTKEFQHKLDLSQGVRYNDPKGVFKTRMDISSCVKYQPFAPTVGTFQTCNIDVTYMLNVHGYLCTTASWYKLGDYFNITKGCTLTGPTFEPSEHMKLYGGSTNVDYVNPAMDLPVQEQTPESSVHQRAPSGDLPTFREASKE